MTFEEFETLAGEIEEAWARRKGNPGRFNSAVPWYWDYPPAALRIRLLVRAVMATGPGSPVLGWVDARFRMREAEAYGFDRPTFWQTTLDEILRPASEV